MRTTDEAGRAAEEELLDEFGTGFQTTRITRHPDGGIRWRRSPGRNRADSYPSVPPGFVQRAEEASGPHLRFATPVSAGTTHGTWSTYGRRSVAKALLPGEGEPDGGLRDTFGRLGAGLRALHDRQPGRQTARPVPPGPARLEHWLENGGGSRAGSGFHVRLRGGLGAARWEKLRTFTAALLRQGEQATGLHGWVSLGSVVLPDRPGPGRPAVVLSGLEAAPGRREVDISSVLGELEEFRIAAGIRGVEQPELRDLAAVFLTRYGDGWDPSAVAAGAVVRIALHAHDFANYVGWHGELHAYVPMLADLLDSDGTTAVPPT